MGFLDDLEINNILKLESSLHNLMNNFYLSKPFKKGIKSSLYQEELDFLIILGKNIKNNLKSLN